MWMNEDDDNNNEDDDEENMMIDIYDAKNEDGADAMTIQARNW